MFLAYPRSNMLLGNSIFEHHYWFRFDHRSLANISQMKPGIYPAGKIVFDSNNEIFKVLNINLKIKEKHLAHNLSLACDSLVFPHQQVGVMGNGKIRKYVPRDSFYCKKIFFKKKADSELHSPKTRYF